MVEGNVKEEDSRSADLTSIQPVNGGPFTSNKSREIWIFTPDFSQNCKKTKPKSKYSRFFLYPHPPLLFATKGMVYICSTSLNLSSNVKILKIDSELSVW